MWETRSKLWQQTYLTQNLLYLFFTFLLIFVQMEVDQTFGNDVVYFCSLVQRSHWVLENHLAFTNDLGIEFFRDFAVDFLTFKVDVTGGGWIDSQDCTTDGRFTGTRFTYQREGFTFVNIKIYMVNCYKLFTTGTEADLKILQFDQFFSFCHSH